MKAEPKPNLSAIRVIPKSQIPPMRSKHDELYEHILAMLAKLPKGQALELNLTKLKIGSESIRHRLHYFEKKEGRSDEWEVQRRATPHGVLLFIWVGSKSEAEQ